MRSKRASGPSDIGCAVLDFSRGQRCGFPEVIFGEGKSPAEIVAIVREMVRHALPVLATRILPEHENALREALPTAEFHSRERCLVYGRWRPMKKGPPQVAVVCAGTSDLPVAGEARISLEFLGWRVLMLPDVGVAGLHRLLSQLDPLRKVKVAIVVAGMEGALPSVVGGLLDCPVVGVPTSVGYGAGSGGWAALAGMLTSCASGLTVVNIDNGFGAAVAAHRILQLQEFRFPKRQN